MSILYLPAEFSVMFQWLLENGFIGSTGQTGSYVSGFTYNDANVLTISQNNQPPLYVTISVMTGLTVNGSVSATTYYGDGSNLTGLVTTDYFVTGGTFNTGTLTLDRQNGSVTVTGFTSTDTYVTGFTYTNNTFTISQNQGQAPLSVTTTPSVSGILSNYYNFA